MPPEFIYTSYKLARHYPPDRTVLEDISISFYPGAKIGVIGPNGALDLRERPAPVGQEHD